MRYSLLLLFFVTTVGRADPPAISFLFPAGGQKGTTLDLQVGGLGLNQSCRAEAMGSGVRLDSTLMRIQVPWFEGAILPLPDSQRQESYPVTMSGKLSIEPNAKSGVRFVRCWTSQGVSGVARFEVGELPELIEKESEGDGIERVALGVTINGRINPREEIDSWEVELKAGQTIHCQVSADRLGSPLQPRLEIRDANKRLLTESRSSSREDPSLSFTAPTVGIYRVRIFDALFGGSQSHIYRLTLTSDVKKTITASIDLDPQLPRVREQEEANDPVKANHLPIPSVGVGCILKPGEKDRWSFSARKGESLEIDLQAARPESSLFGQLTLTDSSGNELVRTSENSSATNPSLQFNAPQDGLYFIEVSDRIRNRGGERFGYRLKIDKPLPSFSLSMVSPSLIVPRGGQGSLKLAVHRRGNFNAPIQLQVEGLPSGISLAKEAIINPGQNGFDLALKGDTSAHIDTSLIAIHGLAWMKASPIDSVLIPIRAEATFQEVPSDPKLNRVRLGVALPTPFKIVGEYSLKLIPRGTTYTRHYKIDRNGFNGPIEISLADRQTRHLQGVTGPSLTVPEGANEFDYPIQLPPWMEIGRTCRVCVLGTAKVKENEAEHIVTYSSQEQNDQIIAVVEPEKLGVELESGSLAVTPNSIEKLRVKIGRGIGIQGRCKVEVHTSEDAKIIEGSTLEIAPDKSEGELQIRVGASMKSNRTVLIRASVMDGKYPVVAEKKLELIVPH